MCSQLNSIVITFCELQWSRSFVELREERLRFVCEIMAGLYPAEFNAVEVLFFSFLLFLFSSLPSSLFPFPFSLFFPFLLTSLFFPFPFLPSPSPPFSFHNDSEHSAQRKQCFSAGPTQKKKQSRLDSQAGQPRTGLLFRIIQQVRQYDLLCP